MSPTTPIKTIGYIGLGNAGYSMSSNLPKNNYNLIVHDTDLTRTARAAREWENTTVADASSPSTAFSTCDILITMLPNGHVVRDVLLGKGGFAPGLKSGTIVVDTSSSSPYHTQTLGKELAGHGLILVDSPITQTYMHATDFGESTLMVGCDDPAIYSRIEPVLRCLASYLFHMGPLGSGHAMKTYNNYIMASSICALSDSLISGQKQFGLKPAQMLDVLNVGTGVCFPTLDTFRRDGLTRRYNSGFGLALLVKDLGITEEVMEGSGLDSDLPGLLRGYLKQALETEGVEPMADHTKALVGWEKRSGVTIEKTEKVEDVPREDFEHRLKGLNRSSDI
jgi:3-hydroxyisobutyrate dehydrogenase-like beta-hydroxyacid dehydrogenase